MSFVFVPLAALAFFVVGAVVRAGLRRLAPRCSALHAQSIFKLVMLALSLAAAAGEGIGLRELGFRHPMLDVWRPALGGGLVLGMLTTLIVLIARCRGLQSLLRGQSFAAIVVGVWIVSSVSEEVFCRGWFQTATGAQSLLPSAMLLGTLHLGLVFAGSDVASMLVIVVATTLLGLVAAWARASSGSLYPAIAAHVAFNAGGLLGGMVYAIAYRVVTGRLPSLPR